MNLAKVVNHTHHKDLRKKKVVLKVIMHYQAIQKVD
mgnify:CR=1 FL=1